MRVLLVHNRYGKPSGEEAVLERYEIMLRERGHAVERFERRSSAISPGPLGKLHAFVSGLGNPIARACLGRVLRDWQPDVVNVHNVFPLISPIALGACSRHQVPVLMTVHNYRILCPNGLLYSRGEVCDRCVGRSEWPCVVRNCERSRMKSIAYAARSAVSRWRGDFRRHVSAFAVLTEFQRSLLVRAGVDGARIVTVPNGARHPVTDAPRGPGDCVAFVGRLTEEKGIGDLIDVARVTADVPYRLFGDQTKAGCLLERLPPNVLIEGAVGAERVAEALRTCRVLVLPSRWLEGFPMAIVEAMHQGCPTIAPRHGGIPEIVEDGVTGWLFRPGDVEDLGRAIREAWGSPDECARRGAAARERARQRFSEAVWGERLEGALRFAIEHSGR